MMSRWYVTPQKTNKQTNKQNGISIDPSANMPIKYDDYSIVPLCYLGYAITTITANTGIKKENTQQAGVHDMCLYKRFI